MVGRVLGTVGVGAALALTGCNGFFVHPSDGGSGSGSTSGGDYVYVVNSANTLSEFEVGSGALTAISGSPISLTSGLAASSVVVSIPNTFVYVGGNGAIECYSVGTTGALTATTAGGASETANFVSMDVTPNGEYLLALDDVVPTVPKLYVFAINTTTGALTLAGSAALDLPVPGAAAVTTTPSPKLKISPSGAFVAVTLGGGGDVIFTLNESTGVLTQSGTLATNGYEDNAVLFDSTSAYAFIGRYGLAAGTGSVVTYSVSTTGALTQTGTIAAGDLPASLVLDSSGDYLYSANRAASTVSSFSLAAGALTVLPSSPIPSGSEVTALARDNSDKYVIAAAAGGSADLTLYEIDVLTPGKLDAIATTTNGSGTAGSVALAATH